MNAPRTIAHQAYGHAVPKLRAVFVVGSESGANGSVVEPVEPVTRRGHHPTAVTSVEHPARMRHPGHRRLVDLADVVPDNGPPYGDAVLPTDGVGAVCAVSSGTVAPLARPVTAEVVRRFHLAGEVPPIHLSATVPAGDDQHQALEARYAGRIWRTA